MSLSNPNENLKKVFFLSKLQMLSWSVIPFKWDIHRLIQMLFTQYEDEWSDVQVNNSILIAWQWKPILIILGIEIDDTIISVLSKHQFARMWFAHRIIISIIIIRLVLVSAENSIHLFWALSPGIYFWLI